MNAIDLIKKHEGLRLTAYRDSRAGVCEHGQNLHNVCADCLALARLAQEREANGE